MPLYAVGSNGSGQLGVGHGDDLSQPELVRRSDTWSVKKLAAGGNHTIILTSSGRVFASGNNEDSRACICSRNTHAFQEMPLWEYNSAAGGESLDVNTVACTWSATFLLLNDGKVMVCGSGASGELGLGNGVTGSRVLRRIQEFPLADAKVVDIAACMGHVVAVLEDGSVFGWGKGRKGQLGEPAEDVWAPRRIEGIGFRARKVAGGKDFTVVLGDRAVGEMVILGPNGRDRFGLRSNAPSALPSNLKSLAASWGTIFVLSDDDRIQAWGRDDHGQLPPKGLSELVSFAAGSEHVLALTKSGKVLAWGWGEHGNCGKHTDDRGDVKARWNEIAVPGRAIRVFAGCATSFIEVAD